MENRALVPETMADFIQRSKIVEISKFMKDKNSVQQAMKTLRAIITDPRRKKFERTVEIKQNLIGVSKTYGHTKGYGKKREGVGGTISGT